MTSEEGGATAAGDHAITSSNRRRQCNIRREPMTSDEEGVTAAGDHAITSKEEAETGEDNASRGSR